MTSIEHLNITVPDIDAAAEFIQLIVPDFKVRKTAISEIGYRWMHIGNEHAYFSLQEPHSGFAPASPNEGYVNFGVNHIGIIIEDAAATEALLLKQGYKPSSDMIVDTHRKRIYFFDKTGVEWEMTEYTSDVFEERYLYE